MKTAITLDENLLKETDKAAKENGVSRSRLISLVLQEYLLRQRSSEWITEQLNRVYAKGQTPEDKRIVSGIKAKLRSVVREPY